MASDRFKNDAKMDKQDLYRKYAGMSESTSGGRRESQSWSQVPPISRLSSSSRAGRPLFSDIKTLTILSVSLEFMHYPRQTAYHNGHTGIMVDICNFTEEPSVS